jgi:hypothetical protein
MNMMKNVVPVLVFGLLLVESGSAATRLGWQCGVNFGEFPGFNYLGFESRSLKTEEGFIIGGIVDLDLGSHLSLRLEPSYVQIRTSLHTGLEASELDDISINVETIQLPVLLVYDFTDTRFRPFVFAGPVPGTVITPGYNKTNLSIDAGMGLAYAVSDDATLELNGRYSAGLADLDPQRYDSPLRTGGYQVQLGVMFGL